MELSSRPIGVFDSGIGGLTVVRALLHHLPNENIVYFGDTARVPYGSKSPQVVREYALQDTDVLLRHNVKMIVVACNTVSAVALDVVQKRAGIPVVGVIIPGAEAATRTTKNGRIGIIGTQGTIASNAYNNAIRTLNPADEVFGQACPLFVPLAEEGWTDHAATELIAKHYLFPLAQNKIDTLVLACTHYPLLKDVIRKVVPQNVTLIDSGEATGRTVKKMLSEAGELNPSSMNPNLQFFVSDIPLKFSEVGERFLGMKLGRVQRES
ncbi:MAG: glutamate racemase [Ignavibacteria bacterium GWA2_55_11]|nr:MAG: glutamate racemase [Ignavibacteria bacterium GWA2_55_11]OGU44229.1 MAG: glutamate racemase [Ignavibacteria bacterium GWC2_56_12]OGU62278.1 MAG: glutamate racemase [Ignavibacteria bacterium RIFCSPHIGHO2_02_FULL_56_12]OGU75738.1 MAG: glutamate racemase [Ignavibacteria bacterium RIFCSPLOWO2_02_FULL_55_14]OGU76832.1 MAG: glutamate racemase [Ignavibacteria bacterium RIFCSPLOWO2_12_FULL_56_21]HAV23166.1 glutamate racemase [Bacteroidota bacterium]